MIWLGRASDDWRAGYSYTGQKFDYYNLLVHGFLREQLSLPLTPALYPQANADGTVATREDAPLDTSWYKGKVYIYYGVVPAVLVMLPYSALTGHDLSPNIPTLIFVLIGYGFSLAWYFRLRGRYFSNASLMVDTAAVILLAFGPATTFLVRRSMFYELPLAAGYACLVASIWALSHALTTSARAPFWLACASFSLGLGAGCHANYALLTPCLALMVGWIARDNLQSGNPSRLVSLIVGAVIPAALIGCGLAIYNYLRFENPFEFGFNHGQNEFFFSKDTLRSTGFVFTNLKWYYFTWPSLAPYFPFVFPTNASFLPPGYHGSEAIHSQFCVSLLMGSVVLAIIIWARRISLSLPIRRLGFFLVAAVVISAGVILTMGIRANRYLVDFQAPLICAAVLAAAIISHAVAASKIKRFWQAGFLFLTLLVATGNILGSVQEFDLFNYTRPNEFKRLSRLLNPSWAFWTKLGLVKTGILAFDVRFASHNEVIGEPLVTTGVPQYSDTVYALQYPNSILEIIIDHFGYGGPRTEQITYEVGKTYHFEIELGSFRPPLSDPSFDDIDYTTAKTIKSLGKVSMDGKPILSVNVPFYESAPWVRLLGKNPLTHTVHPASFSGTIEHVKWLPAPPLMDSNPAVNGHAVVRFELAFPEDEMPSAGQPLLAAGVPGHGSLLFLKPLGPSSWRLVVDEWGFGEIDGPVVSIAPGKHTVTLIVGPLLALDRQVTSLDLGDALKSKSDKIAVEIDGARAGEIRLNRNLNEFDQALLARNTQGFSTAQAYFYGSMRRYYLSTKEVAEVLTRSAR